MKTLISITILLLAHIPCLAIPGKLSSGGNVSDADLQLIIRHCEESLPKFWAAVTDVRNQRVDVRITDQNISGPGKASGTDLIVLSERYLTGKLPNYPEDRLIIVLYHEFGHVLLNRKTDRSQRNPVKHELFAFSYSMMMAKKLAQQGDPGPLGQVVHNLQLRVKNGNPRDPHNIAIKELMETPLWRECTDLLNDTKMGS